MNNTISSLLRRKEMFIPPYTGFTMTAITNSGIRMNHGTGNNNYICEYCTADNWLDERNWNVCGEGNTVIYINQGQHIYWRSTVADGVSADSTGGVNTRLTPRFISTDLNGDQIGGKIELSGDFSSLFQNAIIIATSNGATVKRMKYTYLCVSMFQNCKNIVLANKLDIGKVLSVEQCLNNLFNYCTSLIDGPTITCPSPNQAFAGYWCYGAVFNNCTNLLEGRIYIKWFYTNAFPYIFNGCTRIKKIISYIQYPFNGGTMPCAGWLNAASSTGDIYNLGGYAFPNDINGIPPGWTEHSSLDD